jgi:hypothetical protein
VRKRWAKKACDRGMQRKGRNVIFEGERRGEEFVFYPIM